MRSLTMNSLGPIVCALVTCFGFSSRLGAQSGILMNNGASITPSSTQVSIFASSPASFYGLSDAVYADSSRMSSSVSLATTGSMSSVHSPVRAFRCMSISCRAV